MKNIQYNFQNKHCVVTGGAQGIGLQIAKNFLNSGATVTIWDYSNEGLEKAKTALQNFGSQVHFHQVDVTKSTACIEATKALTAPVDILINNAGITRDKSFSKLTEEDWHAVINTNLTGLFNVTKSVMESFRKNSTDLRIINMSSVVALYGNFGQSNYVAAKAGVVGLTKTWAKEFGKRGFTVNAVAPGFTKTEMVEAMPPEVLASIAEKVPVRRMGETEDIANACLFLASSEAGYLNGTVISVDGGLTL